MLATTKNRFERIWLLARIEFKLRYYENFLGLLWALFKPISDILIYYVAFELIVQSGIPHFVSFLALGLILWNFFSESTTGTIQILATKKYLYEYTNMNKLEIYLSVIMSNFIGFSFNFAMFLLYYAFFDQGTYLSWHVVFMLPILLSLIVFCLGFSMIVSSLYVYFKDITQIWSILIGIGFWISPILYKLEVIRKVFPGLDFANPISAVVINARHAVLDHQVPDISLLMWSFGYAAVVLVIGLYTLNKFGVKAAEKL